MSMLAGSVPPPTAGKTKSVKKGRVKLHPSNALVVQTLVTLSNCCNFDKDYSASARLVVRWKSVNITRLYRLVCPSLGTADTPLQP